LSGGIDVQRDKMFLEFSELIGTGSQQEPPLSDRFAGVWSGRGVKLELEQSGATVMGCYDGNSLLKGTVQGNVLRALGRDDAGIPSQFILIASQDGSIRGLRSTNGAPFKQYDGDVSTKAPSCLTPEPPKLGCGSIVHGIRFDFDSDVIRPSSDAVIADLFSGLSQDGRTGIQIIGHSSSEGAEDYNRDLSQRRAASVVDALVALGLNASDISASGRGEDDPIASNADEAGRSLNRRVEVQCAG
jgi:outer membrane protein OmpA-like peptidoglycan-associated protein